MDRELPEVVRSIQTVLMETPLEAPPPLWTELRRAAVLVVLFPTARGVHFLLTERPASLSRHAGQISLPGGAADPGDATPWHTALRETQEELGIPPDTLQRLGRLPSVPVWASGYLVTPFAAWSARAPCLAPAPHEVERVIEVPLGLLLDVGTIVDEMWEVRGAPYIVTLYRFGDAAIWGATARILYSLSSALNIHVATGRNLPGSILPAEGYDGNERGG